MTTFNGFRIHAAMVKIMKEVEPIAKDRKNQGQGYQFRGIDDCYAALQIVMSNNGVYTTSEILNERTEERQSAKGANLIYRVLTIKWWFHCAEDGSMIDSTTIGEGMDSGDKASNKAMSVSHKYALLQAFCIPTSEPKDPENDSHEIKPKPRDESKQISTVKLKSKQEVAASILKVFGAMKSEAFPNGIGRDKLEKLVKVKLEEISTGQIDMLRDFTTKIKSGEVQIGDIFSAEKNVTEMLNDQY